jgi:hypothetical protein
VVVVRDAAGPRRLVVQASKVTAKFYQLERLKDILFYSVGFYSFTSNISQLFSAWPFLSQHRAKCGKKLHKISKIYKLFQTQDSLKIHLNFPRKTLISIIYIFEEKGETPRKQI